jgi:hypothetical protein
VNRAVGGLIFGSEQPFDLLVGGVHRAHPAGFILTLVAQPHRGLGEGNFPFFRLRFRFRSRVFFRSRVGIV